MRNMVSLETLPRESIRRPIAYNPFADARERFILENLNRQVISTLTHWSQTAPPGSRVLDLGCGQQPYRELCQSLGFQYQSFDVQQNDALAVDYIGHVDGTLPENILAAGPFDFVLCTEVAEHVLYWEKMFQNISMLLKPGGRLLLTCPFTFPLHEEPYDYYRPTLYALEGWAKLMGFRSLESKSLGSIEDVLCLILGHCLLKMKYQAPQSLMERIRLAVKQRLVRLFLYSCHFVIRSGFLKENFSSLKDFYVTNSIELVKESA